MTRFFLFSILVAWAAGSFADGEGALTESGASPDPIQAMEERLETISDPAAKLFFQAGIEQAKGDLEPALQTLARLIVLYADNEEWVPRSDLLCAEIYFQLGMMEAADVTARQVQFMNKGTETADQAQLLREKIKQVREQSTESE